MTAKKPLALAVVRYTIFRISYVWTGGVSQERNLGTAALGLALMYPAYQWSVSAAPGHHGYQRASDL